MEAMKHQTFIDSMKFIMKWIKECNERHGFDMSYPDEMTIPNEAVRERYKVILDLAVIDLVHTELSEMSEAIRCGNGPDEKLPEFTQAEVEAADAIIRLLHLGQTRNWRLPEAIMVKVEYNETRSFRHGNKKF